MTPVRANFDVAELNMDSTHVRWSRVVVRIMRPVPMPEDRAALIRRLTQVECLRQPPCTLEDECAIIARVTIAVRGQPRSEAELFGLAGGMPKASSPSLR